MAIEERTNKDGTRSFRARVRDPGGKWYAAEWRRHPDEAAVDQGEQQGRRRKGEVVPRALTEGRKYTWSDFWEVFASCDRTETSDGWKISQDQMERDYVRPVLGKKLMADITSPHVGQVLSRMKKMGRGEQMRQHVYRLLNQVFDRAVKYYRMIPENPVNPKYHRVKVKQQQAPFLFPEQTWALLEAARDQDERAVWIEGLAAIRIEATVVLRWPDVQWESNQISVERAFKHKVRRIDPFPKGKDAEYVPMPPPLKEFLWDCYQRSPNKEGWVCPGPRGGHLKPETYGPRLKKLCARIGLPEISSHVLRHSCTELFVNVGASQEDLRRLLNHKSSTTTLRYMHRTDQRLKSVAASIQRPKLEVIPGGGGESCTHESTHVGTFQRTQFKEVSGT